MPYFFKNLLEKVEPQTNDQYFEIIKNILKWKN